MRRALGFGPPLFPTTIPARPDGSGTPERGGAASPPATALGPMPVRVLPANLPSPADVSASFYPAQSWTVPANQTPVRGPPHNDPLRPPPSPSSGGPNPPPKGPNMPPVPSQGVQQAVGPGPAGPAPDEEAASALVAPSLQPGTSATAKPTNKLVWVGVAALALFFISRRRKSALGGYRRRRRSRR